MFEKYFHGHCLLAFHHLAYHLVHYVALLAGWEGFVTRIYFVTRIRFASLVTLFIDW